MWGTQSQSLHKLLLAWDSGLHLWVPLPKALILAVLSLAAQPPRASPRRVKKEITCFFFFFFLSQRCLRAQHPAEEAALAGKETRSASHRFSPTLLGREEGNPLPWALLLEVSLHSTS